MDHKLNTKFRIRITPSSVSILFILLTEFQIVDHNNYEENKLDFQSNSINERTPKKKVPEPIKTKNNFIGLSSAKKA